jgi:hypothetical protein
LTLDLILKMGGFIAGADKAERRLKTLGDSAERFGRSLGNNLKGAVAGLAGFLGVTASIAGAVTAIKTAIDRADSLRDLSIRVGASTEALSGFSYAAKQTGTDIDALSKGMLILSKNTALALDPKSRQAGLFKALGIDKSELGDIEKLIPRIADSFALLEDGTQKAALAQQLFGRSGAGLIEFLNQGSAGLKTMADRAAELGIVISQDTADAADQFNDTLGDLQAAGTGLATELASALLPQLQGLADWAVDFVTDGDKVESLTRDLKDGFSELGDAMSAAGDAGGVFLTFADRVRGTLQDMETDLREATVRVAEFFAVYEYQRRGAERLRQNITADFGNVQGGPAELERVTVVADADAIAQSEAKRIRDARALQDKIAGYLGNPTGRTGAGTKKKTGKSDEDKLLETYQKMEASYREQNALVGDITEVERLRYELTNGEGSKFSEAQKSNLLALAAEKDAIEAANEQMEEAKALIDSLLQPFERINEERAKAKELLDAGRISQEDYNKAMAAQLTPAEDMLEDLAFERELLGKTADEQERLTAARLLGAEAATVQGQAAMEALRNFQAESKATAEQVAVMDDIRDGFGDFFSTLIDGSASASDAFKSLIDDILKSLSRWASNQLVEQFLGSYGSTNSGASAGGGFDWGALIGSFMGGGKASGGWTMPGMVNEVNERGFEMASVGGRDYMLTGPQPVNITPAHRTGRGGGFTQIIHQHYKSPESSRTRSQVAADTAYVTQLAYKRNG